MKKIITSYSYLFHPIFIPFFGTLLYFFQNINYFDIRQIYLVLIQVSIISVFIPISFFYLLKTLGLADSLMLDKLNQRKIPLIAQVFLTGILIQKSIKIELMPELYFFFLSGLISLIAALTLLFLKIKASLHLLGISSLTTFMIGLSIHNQINILYFIALLLLINGLVASSRLILNAHTPKELGIGFILGTIPQLILWYFWL